MKLINIIPILVLTLSYYFVSSQSHQLQELSELYLNGDFESIIKKYGNASFEKTKGLLSLNKQEQLTNDEAYKMILESYLFIGDLEGAKNLQNRMTEIYSNSYYSPLKTGTPDILHFHKLLTVNEVIIRWQLALNENASSILFRKNSVNNVKEIESNYATPFIGRFKWKPSTSHQISVTYMPREKLLGYQGGLSLEYPIYSFEGYYEKPLVNNSIDTFLIRFSRKIKYVNIPLYLYYPLSIRYKDERNNKIYRGRSAFGLYCAGGLQLNINVRDQMYIRRIGFDGNDFDTEFKLRRKERSFLGLSWGLDLGADFYFFDELSAFFAMNSSMNIIPVKINDGLVLNELKDRFNYYPDNVSLWRLQFTFGINMNFPDRKWKKIDYKEF